MCESTEPGGLYPIFLSVRKGRSGLLSVALGCSGGRAMYCSTAKAGVTVAKRPLEKAVRMSLSPDQLCTSPCSLSYLLGSPAESFLPSASAPLSKERP